MYSKKKDSTIFDDTMFPSQIRQVRSDGSVKRAIELPMSKKAIDMYSDNLKKDLENNMTFKKLKEVKFMNKALDLFEPTKITITEN